jgi:hypothetical protein
MAEKDSKYYELSIIYTDFVVKKVDEYIRKTQKLLIAKDSNDPKYKGFLVFFYTIKDRCWNVSINSDYKTLTLIIEYKDVFSDHSDFEDMIRNKDDIHIKIQEIIKRDFIFNGDEFIMEFNI